MVELPLPVETLSVFFAASVALSFAPGPDNIFVITESALSGRLSGFFVTLGLCTWLDVSHCGCRNRRGRAFCNFGKCVQPAQNRWRGLSSFSRLASVSCRCP